MRSNLILITINFASSAFCYYMISFYSKYVSGNMFFNLSFASLAEVIGCLFLDPIVRLLGDKKTMSFAYLMTGFFGLALSLINPNSTYLIMVCLFFTKMGSAITYTMCFIVTADYFETLYTSTAFGAAFFFSRIFTCTSSVIAEAQ